MVLPLLEGTDMFITGIKIKPVNNIKLFLDADSGLSIEKSANVNRKLYKLIEAAAIFPEGDFSLEVSSPGIDEPLVNVRQYHKNIGRTLLVAQTDGAEVLGVLGEVTEEGIVMEVAIGKKVKKEITQVTIPFSNISKAVVQVVF